MKRILVTGGSGFIGTNLVQRYLDQDATILNIDLEPPRNAAHQPFWIRQDIRDRAGLVKVVEEFQPDYLFHLAARTDINGTDIRAYDSNTVGVENVIVAARTIPNFKRLVVTSSQLVCRLGYQPKDDGDYCPINTYGESKVLTEKIVRETAAESLPWVIGRPTSVWGPWFGAPYRNFFDAIHSGMYLYPRGCTIRKNFSFAGNIAFQLQGIAECSPRLAAGKTMYLIDDALDLWEWTCLIQRQLGARPVRSVPPGLLALLARLGDLYKGLGRGRAPIDSYRLGNMLTDIVQDSGPVRQACGPVPYSLAEGVRQTVAWMKEHDQTTENKKERYEAMVKEKAR